MTRILLPGDRRRIWPSRQRIDERHDFTRAGRATLVRTAAIGIFDLAVSFLARAADDALARRGEPDGDARHGPLEFGEHIEIGRASCRERVELKGVGRVCSE